MKKLLSVTIGVMLILAMAFSLVACGGEAGSGGTTAGGGNGGKTPGGEPPEGVLATLGNNYKIDLTYSAEEYGQPVTEHEVFAANNGAYLYRYFYRDSEAERTLLFKDGHCYDYNEYVGFFGGCTTKDIERSIEQYNGWKMLIKISNNAQKIEFTGQENATYLGRACTKYINQKHFDSDGWLSAYDVDAYYIVDNATKLCLKYENKTTVYDEQGAVKEEGTEDFQVTEFAVGSANVDDMLAKIKFDEWVSAQYLTECGLANVAAPVGTFVRYNLNCDEDTKTIESYSGTYQMTEANARVFCDALYNAGVQYGDNNDTTVLPKNEIYRETTDEDGNPDNGYFSFYGYTSNGGYVNVYGEMQEDGTYEMEITVS